jgi:hypothetical protein
MTDIDEDNVIGEMGVYWDHRLISDGESIWIGEVYYGDDDEVTGFTGRDANLLKLMCFNPDGEGYEEGMDEAEVKGDFDLMATAFTKPTLKIPPCFQPPEPEESIREVFPWEER